MDAKPNVPLLAEVQAPWDGLQSGSWELLDPKNLWQLIDYRRRYKGYWVPTSMDTWRYRGFLEELDEPCLRGLKSQGALTARELADWLNRTNCFRTKPNLTGIHQISVATAHDWIGLARRRDYVVAWRRDPDSVFRKATHWQLTERGDQAIRSKLMSVLRRIPYASLVSILVGGGLVAAFNWLATHPTAIVVTFIALLVVIELVVVNIWFSRWEKRENPGIAVVAIETLRSAGRPVPVLTSR